MDNGQVIIVKGDQLPQLPCLPISCVVAPTGQIQTESKGTQMGQD